ncbi:MAG TPA: RICIN domain-containing protein [Microbacteriaceae bacterium]
MSPALRFIRRPPRQARISARTGDRRTLATAVAATAVVLAAAVAVSGGSFALWNGRTTVNAGTVTAGTLSVAETISASLTTTYNSGNTTTTGSVLVTNAGNVTADYTASLTLGTGSSTTLANSITVTAWPVAGPSSCTASALVPAGAATGTWASMIAGSTAAPVTGTLPAGGSVTYCLRSAMNVTAVPAGISSGDTLTPVVTTDLSVAGWSTSASASLTQTFRDDMPPTAPSALASSNVSATSTKLAWTAATDNVGVIAYDVYRSGTNTPIGTTTATDFTDTIVAANTTYTYTVKARDAAGNTTSSAGLLVDRTAPSIPTLTATAASPTSVTLSWSAATDNVGVTGYDLFRDGAFWQTVSALSATDTVAAGSTHTYTVRSRDAAGNTSASSGTATVTTVPVTQTNWYQVTNVGTGQCIEATSWGTAPGTALTHQACVVPATGNQTWRFTTSDSGYFVVSPGYAAGNLVWDVNGAGMGDGVQVFLWGLKTSGIANQQWQLVPAGNGQFQIVSRNSGLCLDAGGYANGTASNSNTMRQLTCVAGNTSQLFTFTTAIVGSGGMPPTAPATLTANGTTSSATTLTWSAATDDNAVTGYTIYRSDLSAPVGTVTGSTLTFTDSTLTPGATYTYSVVATDAAGNLSPRSSSVSVTTTAATPTLMCTQQDPYNAVVTWTNPAGAPTSTKYDVLVNGVVVSSKSQTYYYTTFEITSSVLSSAGVSQPTTGIPVVVRISGQSTPLFSRTIGSQKLWNEVVPLCQG